MIKWDGKLNKYVVRANLMPEIDCFTEEEKEIFEEFYKDDVNMINIDFDTLKQIVRCASLHPLTVMCKNGTLATIYFKTPEDMKKYYQENKEEDEDAFVLSKDNVVFLED